MTNDDLANDLELVHTTQSLISEYLQRAYPAVKRLSTSKNNKNILNLTNHETDFGIPVSWSFNATAHGKGPVVKYRAIRKVLSGTIVDAILTPEDLYKFVQKDSSLNVFCLKGKYRWSNRWTRDRAEGENQFIFPFSINECFFDFSTDHRFDEPDLKLAPVWSNLCEED